MVLILYLFQFCVEKFEFTEFFFVHLNLSKILFYFRASKKFQFYFTKKKSKDFNLSRKNFLFNLKIRLDFQTELNWQSACWMKYRIGWIELDLTVHPKMFREKKRC